MNIRTENNARFVNLPDPDWVSLAEGEGDQPDQWTMRVPAGESLTIDPDPSTVSEDRYVVTGSATIVTNFAPASTSTRGRVHSVECPAEYVESLEALVARSAADYKALKALGLSERLVRSIVNSA